MKPSPAQARILKDLSAEHDDRYWDRPSLHLWFDKATGNMISAGSNNIKQNVGVSTVRVLLDQEWIEIIVEGSSKGLYTISDTGRNILDLLNDADFLSTPSNNKKPFWSTRDIYGALFEKYRKLNNKGYQGAPVWVYFSELRDERYASRRVDFWAMACWKSLNYRRISYEIKISRGDFLHELKHPEKRAFALEISQQYYFVTPPNLVELDELPEECGLIELSEKGRLITKKKAPIRLNNDFEFTWEFAASLGRQIWTRWEKENVTNENPTV